MIESRAGQTTQPRGGELVATRLIDVLADPYPDADTSYSILNDALMDDLQQRGPRSGVNFLPDVALGRDTAHQFGHIIVSPSHTNVRFVTTVRPGEPAVVKRVDTVDVSTHANYLALFEGTREAAYYQVDATAKLDINRGESNEPFSDWARKALEALGFQQVKPQEAAGAGVQAAVDQDSDLYVKSDFAYDENPAAHLEGLHCMYGSGERPIQTALGSDFVKDVTITGRASVRLPQGVYALVDSNLGIIRSNNECDVIFDLSEPDQVMVPGRTRVHDIRPQARKKWLRKMLTSASGLDLDKIDVHETDSVAANYAQTQRTSFDHTNVTNDHVPVIVENIALALESQRIEPLAVGPRDVLKAIVKIKGNQPNYTILDD